MDRSEVILLSLIVISAVVVLGIGGYLLYRKVQALDVSSEGYAPEGRGSKGTKSKKENFEVKINPSQCILIPNEAKQPEGWICFTHDENIKRCCSEELKEKEQLQSYGEVTESSLKEDIKEDVDINVCYINGSQIPCGEAGRYHGCFDGIGCDFYSELKMVNDFDSTIYIGYHSPTDDKNIKARELAIIAPKSYMFIYYDGEGNSFEPGCVFYPYSVKENKELSPFVLGEEDYEIKFAKPNQISLINIINNRDIEYDVYDSLGKYVGRVGSYSPDKFAYEYTLTSDNNHQGFSKGNLLLKPTEPPGFNKEKPEEYVEIKSKIILN